MYAYISGSLIDKHPTHVVIDVHGVGYDLFISMATFERLPEVRQPIKLHTYYHVREDAALLFGFLCQKEKRVFETMLGVSGIGPRLALAALSVMNPDDLRLYIMHGDTAMLTSIPGVGRKTAERLVVELRDRFANMEYPVEGTATGERTTSAEGPVWADAMAALESLGYTRTAAEKTLRRVLKSHHGIGSVEEMVRLALRE